MPSAPVTLATPAMGTRFELVLAAADRSAEPRLRAAGEAALDEIRHWHDRLSWFDAGSFISHINTHAASRAVECDPEFFELLRLCREVWAASEGAFDPTIAALMRAAGFRDLASQDLPQPTGGAGVPPASCNPSDRDARIAEARAATGFDNVILDEQSRTIRFTTPGVALDLGAIGKGWAIDRAARLLCEAGVTAALIHGGTSSIAAIGSPPDAHGWLVRVGPHAEAPTVPLVDLSLGVSAPTGRMVRTEAGSHGHILDPRTGRSVASADLAAVIAGSCALADAWSTALLVVGDRPAGMPAELTSLLRPAGESPQPWRIAGPHAPTLIRS